MFWWLLKFVLLGPVLRLVYRPRAQGLDNVPSGGGAILVANHLSALETLLLPIVVPRKLVFLGKAELFDRWYSAWFFRALGVIPVRRGQGSPAEDALRAAVAALGQGQLVGIFPEGTRSPDGRLYRGKTGVARMALQARVAVIPVGIVGTRKERGAGRKRRIEIRFGKPLDFSRYHTRPDDRFVARAVTDEVMYEIMLLSGQEYVDEYADRVKERLARGPAPAPQASWSPGQSERSRR
jgi:1-acyl-sn-glycerol-3-phosphate acyltransferase